MWPLWRHLLSCLKIRRVSGEKDHETGTPVLVGMENFENEKTQTSDSRGGSFCPVSGSADIFPVFRRRNGAQPRREGRIFLQPDPFLRDSALSFIQEHSWLARGVLEYFRQRAGIYALWLFSAGHLGADETLVYHSTLKLCHESSCGDDAACRQSRKL